MRSPIEPRSCGGPILWGLALLLAGCAAQMHPDFENVYRRYDVPDELVARVRENFRRYGLVAADVTRDRLGRLQLAGRYANEDEVDRAFVIAQNVVGLQATSMVYPTDVREKAWERSTSAAFERFIERQRPPASNQDAERAASSRPQSVSGVPQGANDRPAGAQVRARRRHRQVQGPEGSAPARRREGRLHAGGAAARAGGLPGVGCRRSARRAGDERRRPRATAPAGAGTRARGHGLRLHREPWPAADTRSTRPGRAQVPGARLRFEHVVTGGDARHRVARYPSHRTRAAQPRTPDRRGGRHLLQRKRVRGDCRTSNSAARPRIGSSDGSTAANSTAMRSARRRSPGAGRLSRTRPPGRTPARSAYR